MRKYKKQGTVLLILCLLSAAAGYGALAGQDRDEDSYTYQEETVLCGDLAQGITETGNVAFVTSSQKYDLQDTAAEEEEDGDEEDDTRSCLKVEEVYIVPGERIQQGGRILRLDEKSIAAVRRRLQAELSEAQIALAQAEEDYALGILSAGHSYQESQLAGETAEEEYEISSVILQKEIEESAARVKILEQEIKQTGADLEEEWDAFEELREAYEEAEYEYERCDNSLISKYITLRDTWLIAKEDYEKVQKARLDRREQMADQQEQIAEIEQETASLMNRLERKSLDVRQQYETAVLEKNLADEVYGYTTEGLADRVSSAAQTQQEQQQLLDDFEAFTGEGIIYAEGGGLVTEVNIEQGDYLIGTGNLFSYVEESGYVVNVDISEEDIARVQVGDEVSIRFSAYEDQQYQGTVSAVTTEASPEYTAAVSYPVTISVEGDGSGLYGGMSADVTFIMEEAAEVLYVPRKAVVEQDGRSYVYTGAGEEKQLTEVKTGFTDGTHIQITEGVSEGDKIYIRCKTEGGPANEA